MFVGTICALLSVPPSRMKWFLIRRISAAGASRHVAAGAGVLFVPPEVGAGACVVAGGAELFELPPQPAATRTRTASAAGTNRFTARKLKHALRVTSRPSAATARTP